MPTCQSTTIHFVPTHPSSSRSILYSYLKKKKKEETTNKPFNVEYSQSTQAQNNYLTKGHEKKYYLTCNK